MRYALSIATLIILGAATMAAEIPQDYSKPLQPPPSVPYSISPQEHQDLINFIEGVSLPHTPQINDFLGRLEAFFRHKEQDAQDESNRAKAAADAAAAASAREKKPAMSAPPPK